LQKERGVSSPSDVSSSELESKEASPQFPAGEAKERPV